MIVRPLPDGALLLVSQEAHAHVAGELAARLVDAPEPVAPFVAATRVHDNGWREEDAAPRWDVASGAPHSYRSLPDAPYEAVWRRGIARAAGVDAHVGLLVGMHGARFLRSGNAAFAREERARQEAALAELGLPRASVTRQSAWLLALDAASLFACGDLGATYEAHVDAATRLRFSRPAEGVVGVAPFPWRAAMAFEVPALRLARTDVRDEATLREAVAAAPRVRVRVTFRPADA